MPADGVKGRTFSGLMRNSTQRKCKEKGADRLQLVPVDKDAASGSRPDLEVPGEGTDPEEGGSPAPGGRNDLAAEATSVRHMLCHEFHNTYCQACVESKMSRAKCMCRGCAEVRRAKKTTFGELITAGHLIRRDDAGCPDYEPGEDVLEGAQNALGISDSCIEFIGAKQKDPSGITKATTSFNFLCCDNAGELVGSGLDMEWNADTSTPGEPKSSGTVERIVGHIKEGLRTNLRASGMPPLWWLCAGRHFAFAWNATYHAGHSPYVDRFNKICKAPRIPFGAMVWFLPTLRHNNKSRPGNFGAVALKGIFLADHTHTGREWRGDFEVAELGSFLDDPGCFPAQAKNHRISRVGFYP